MNDLNIVINKYWGFKFWSSKRRYFSIYIPLSFFCIIVIGVLLKQIFEINEILFVIISLWLASMIIFAAATRYLKGFEEYLYYYNDDIRKIIFGNIIFVKGGSPLCSSIGPLKFIRLENNMLDKTLLNLKHNIRSSLIGTAIVFFIMFPITVMLIDNV